MRQVNELHFMKFIKIKRFSMNITKGSKKT